MESSDSGLNASRRNLLKTGALGVGALGAMGTVSAAASSASAAVAPTAGDIFLKIDGIPGGSLDERHKDEIEVLSFSWGAVGDDKDPLQDFQLSTVMSKASPLLMLGSAKGTHVKQATLTARKAGEDQQEFLKITLKDCVVTSYQSSGSTGGAPADQFGLTYATVTFSYTEPSPDGSPGTPVEVTYP